MATAASADQLYWDADGTATGNDATTGAGLGSSTTNSNNSWDTTSIKWWDGSSGSDVAWVSGDTHDAIFKASSAACGGCIITLNSPIVAGSLTMLPSGNTNAFSFTDNGVHTNTLEFTTLTVPTVTNTQTTITAIVTGNHDINIVDNNDSGKFNNVAFGIGGTFTQYNFTGNVNLKGTIAGAGTQDWASRLSLLINSGNSTTPLFPATATFNYERNMSQVDFNAGIDFGSYPNNFVLNTGGLTASTFEGWIGALASATVNLTGQISGNGGLTFGLGVAGGGGGVITLSPTTSNTYTGNTKWHAANAGVIKLGVNNALPTTTGLIFGINNIGGGSFDLNGKDLTVASLASGVITSGVQNGIVNTQSGVSTLTIDGSAITSYTGPLGSAVVVTNLLNAANHDKIKLVLASTNTGQLTLGRAAGMAYSGGTEINGGTLVVSNTSNSGTGTGDITIGGSGTLKIGDGTTAGGANGSVNNHDITDNGNVTFNRTDATSYTGIISGTGTVTKVNTGALTFSGSNSYSGDTTISAGSLIASGASVTVGGGDVSVTGGALEISGGVSDAIVDTKKLTLLGGATPDMADTGYLNLGSGVNERVGMLVLGSTTQSNGLTYGSIASSALVKSDEYFAGIGILSVGLPGDFNGNGVVDAADYVNWRTTPSNFGGDPAGYDLWRANFGAGSPGSGSNLGGGAAVPEPGTMSLVIFTLGCLVVRCRSVFRSGAVNIQ